MKRATAPASQHEKEQGDRPASGTALQLVLSLRMLEAIVAVIIRAGGHVSVQVQGGYTYQPLWRGTETIISSAIPVANLICFASVASAWHNQSDD